MNGGLIDAGNYRVEAWDERQSKPLEVLLSTNDFDLAMRWFERAAKNDARPLTVRQGIRVLRRTHEEPDTPRGREAYIFDEDRNPYPTGSLGAVMFWCIMRMVWPARVKKMDRRSIAVSATEAMLERLKNWHIAPPPPAKNEVSPSQATERKADSV